MARVRRPSFSLAVIVVGGLALAGLVVFRFAGVGVVDDDAASSPVPVEPAGEECAWWDHGHVHAGRMADGECRPVDSAHAGDDHGAAADDIPPSVDPSTLRPAARGEPAPSFALADRAADGSWVPAVDLMPPSSPAVIEWSDWCFFGPVGGVPGGGSYECSLEMAHFAAALVHLGADEACVLEQHRLRIEAGHEPGRLPGETVNAYGWHRCASVIDPDPEPGADWTGECEALTAGDPLIAEFVATWWGDCEVWAEQEQARHAQRPEWLQSPDCARARSLAYLWTHTHVEDELRLGSSMC